MSVSYNQYCLKDPMSIGVTMSNDEYPSGSISWDGGYFKQSQSLSTGYHYYYKLYLCDSSGTNAKEIATVDIVGNSSGWGQNSYPRSGTISAEDGKDLRGKSLYIKASFDYMTDQDGNRTGSYSDGVKHFTFTGDVTFTVNTANVYSASTINSKDNVEFGDTSTIGIKINSATNDVWHKVTWYIDNDHQGYVNTGIGGTSASLQIDATWATTVTNDVSKTINISLETFKSNNQKIGDTVNGTITATVKSTVVPTVSIAVSISNQHAQGTFASQYVQSLTGVQITTTAAGVYGSTINDVYITVSPNEATTKSGNNFSISALKNSGTVSITVTVVDSRGRQASDTKQITVIQYRPPTFRTTSAYRANADWLADEEGTYAVIRAIFDYASSITGNSITVNSQYYVYEGGEQTAVNNMANGTDYLIGAASGQSGALDPAYTYRVKFTATDTIGGVTTMVTVVQTAAYAIHVMNGGTGVAFGKVSEHGNSVELNPGWDFRYRDLIQPAFIYYVPTVDDPEPDSPFEGLVWLKPKT